MIDLERVARRLARRYGEDHGWPTERIERHVRDDWREYLWSARAAALDVIEQLLENVGEISRHWVLSSLVQPGTLTDSGARSVVGLCLGQVKAELERDRP